MSVQIRVARKKRPTIQHRPFTEREKELNKMSRKDMAKEWHRKFNPYKMKAIKEFDNGKSNPFYYMSIYKIQQFLKTWEQSPDFPLKEDNKEIDEIIEMVVMFKDLLHVTTSEAMATYMIFKDKLEARARDQHLQQSDITDELLADLAYKAITEFRQDWNKAMGNLQPLFRH